MKKFSLGLLIGILLSSSIIVFGANIIKSAEYNNTNVSINGVVQELENPLVSIIEEGSPNMVNYMPIREILENLGYNVNWIESKNTIDISKKEVEVAEKVEEKLIEEVVEEKTKTDEYLYIGEAKELISKAGLYEKYTSRYYKYDNRVNSFIAVENNKGSQKTLYTFDTKVENDKILVSKESVEKYINEVK